jgi:hypothetical protein
MIGESNHFKANPEGAQNVAAGKEEVMVADVRAGLTPAQMVERRLVSLLKVTPLPMSRLQTTNPRRPL